MIGAGLVAGLSGSLFSAWLAYSFEVKTFLGMLLCAIPASLLAAVIFVVVLKVGLAI